MNKAGLARYEFVDYSEHAISVGSDSKAISYIHIKNPQGKDIFGIGVSHNIGYASMKGIICAINRDQKDTMRDDTMPGIFDKCWGFDKKHAKLFKQSLSADCRTQKGKIWKITKSLC